MERLSRSRGVVRVGSVVAAVRLCLFWLGLCFFFSFPSLCFSAAYTLVVQRLGVGSIEYLFDVTCSSLIKVPLIEKIRENKEAKVPRGGKQRKMH